MELVRHITAPRQERICSMAGGIQDTVRQLQSLARMIANISPTAGEEPEITAADIGHAMGLFVVQLSAVHNGLDDIIGNAEFLIDPKKEWGDP